MSAEGELADAVIYASVINRILWRRKTVNAQEKQPLTVQKVITYMLIFLAIACVIVVILTLLGPFVGNTVSSIGPAI